MFRPRGLGGGKMRAGVKPAGQRRAPRQRRRFAREVGENRLGHILGEVCVAVDLPQRRGIDQIEVPAHQFGEGFFGMGPGIAAEQFGIGRHVQLIAPAQREIAQEKSGLATIRFGDLTWRSRCANACGS